MEFFANNIVLGEVLVQLFAFLIVFFVLKRLAWKPLLKAIEERRERIREEFVRIEHAQKEVERLKTDYASHLQKIDEEAREKIQEAIEEGRRIAREIQEKARHESLETVQKTKESLEIEIAKARVELKKEIADLAVRVAEKILEENLNEEKQQKKIAAMLDALSADDSALGGLR
ncbi:MAG: F0F1 ATP synthase subunit B [Candidatus Omnitrophota bacterium]